MWVKRHVLQRRARIHRRTLQEVSAGRAHVIVRTYARALQGPVAQLVEHRTFNAVVAGSSPARLTILKFNNLRKFIALLNAMGV